MTRHFVEKPPMRRECPRCGFEARGKPAGNRVAYLCPGCGSRFWAPAVVVVVSGRVVSEKVRPLRRGRGLI